MSSSVYEVVDYTAARWSAELLQSFGPLRADVGREYQARYSKDRTPANVWLRDAHEMLTHAPKILRDLHTLEDINDVSKWAAETCAKFATGAELSAFVLRHQLPRVNGSSEAGQLARSQDWQFWRRVLRRAVARYRDQLMRHLGYVHRHKQVYCSDQIVRWQRQRQTSNLEVLQSLLAVSDCGDEVSLAELHQASLANPALRRAELLTRIRGFENLADDLDHAALFITLTAPSKYHARHAKSGRANLKWTGATPTETNQYLNKVWARVRAALHQRGIKPYGFRIVEPHHDGCPHWHILLFVEHGSLADLQALFLDRALQEDGDEKGAKTRRVTFKRIDRSKGTAVAYIIKYVSKSIDGYGVGDDLYGNKAEAAADRIVAWARTWGIRQFQQIGGPSVTVWREYRREREVVNVVPPHHVPWICASAPGDLKPDWSRFCVAMGGTAPGRDQPTKLLRRPALDPTTGELLTFKNRYGETAPRPVIGLVREGVEMLTHPKTWTIERNKSLRSRLSDFRGPPLALVPHGGAILRDGEASSAWTRVTNCREPPDA